MSDEESRLDQDKLDEAQSRLEERREVLGISGLAPSPFPPREQKEQSEPKEGYTVEWPLRDIDGIPTWRDTDWAKEMGAPN